jgi:hypothetical protein
MGPSAAPFASGAPDEFDVLTVVITRRATDAPELSEADLDALQTRHLAYRADLRQRGLIAVNGPFDGQSDPAYRGMAIFTCDAAEAVRLSEGDPSIVAGRLTYDVMEWWVQPGGLAFPLSDRAVGERRPMSAE